MEKDRDIQRFFETDEEYERFLQLPEVDREQMLADLKREERKKRERMNFDRPTEVEVRSPPSVIRNQTLRSLVTGARTTEEMEEPKEHSTAQDYLDESSTDDSFNYEESDNLDDEYVPGKGRRHESRRDKRGKGKRDMSRDTRDTRDRGKVRGKQPSGHRRKHDELEIEGGSSFSGDGIGDDLDDDMMYDRGEELKERLIIDEDVGRYDPELKSLLIPEEEDIDTPCEFELFRYIVLSAQVVRQLVYKWYFQDIVQYAFIARPHIAEMGEKEISFFRVIGTESDTQGPMREKVDRLVVKGVRGEEKIEVTKMTNEFITRDFFDRWLYEARRVEYNSNGNNKESLFVGAVPTASFAKLCATVLFFAQKPELRGAKVLFRRLPSYRFQLPIAMKEKQQKIRQRIAEIKSDGNKFLTPIQEYMRGLGRVSEEELQGYLKGLEQFYQNELDKLATKPIQPKKDVADDLPCATIRKTSLLTSVDEIEAYSAFPRLLALRDFVLWANRGML